MQTDGYQIKDTFIHSSPLKYKFDSLEGIFFSTST